MTAGADLDRYAGFLDTLPDGAMLVDQHGTIALANDAAGQLFGYRPDELSGQAIEALVPESKQAAHRDLVGRYIAQPERRPMGSGLQLRARRGDGELLPVDIMLSPVDLGKARYTVCIVRDMSEQRRLETALETALAREKSVSRTDHLTGSANRRQFAERLQGEIDRSKRYERTFSMAYLDLDHFKQVNDQMGHATGDRLLARVAEIMMTQSRRTDTVARVGGDEFAVLFPETEGPAVRIAVDKLRTALLEEMRRNSWPVTFSIGVISCTAPPDDAKELIEAADSLMYAAKESGRDAIRYGQFPGEVQEKKLEVGS